MCVEPTNGVEEVTLEISCAMIHAISYTPSSACESRKYLPILTKIMNAIFVMDISVYDCFELYLGRRSELDDFVGGDDDGDAVRNALRASGFDVIHSCLTDGRKKNALHAQFDEFFEFLRTAQGQYSYLLFTKSDIFRKKLQRVPLSVCFEDIDEGIASDYSGCIGYLSRQAQNYARRSRNNTCVDIHICNLIDSETARQELQSCVTDIIFGDLI